MISWCKRLIFWTASLSVFGNVTSTHSSTVSKVGQQSTTELHAAQQSDSAIQPKGDKDRGSSLLLWHPCQAFRPIPQILCCVPQRRGGKGPCLPVRERTKTDGAKAPKCRTGHLREGDKVPHCIWKLSPRKAESSGQKPKWHDLDSREIFDNKRVVIIGLPGAFTPVCTSWHLPSFEAAYEDLMKEGIDAVYCITVNDSFVTSAWAKQLKIKKVTVVPDGNACFTYGMGMLVRKSNLGFGCRSWRYAAVVDHGVIEKLFVEPCLQDDAETDSHTVSTVENVLAYLRSKRDRTSDAEASD